MTGQDMERMPGGRESHVDRAVHDWLADVIEPLPARIKDEVVVQAAVIPQRGRWPWQRRHARLRLDTMSLGFAPIAVAAVVLAMTALGLLLLVLQPSDEMAPLPATSPSPVESPLDTTDDSTAGFTFEEVEPGVYRFVDDGAGHDASDLPNSGKWLYKLTAAPDGTIWLPRLDEILHLGEPGFVENPIGPGALELDIEADGSLWIRNGAVLAPDGAVVGERTDVSDPRIVELVAHPEGGMIASLTYPDDRSELRRWTTGMDDLGELVAPPLPSDGTDWQLWDVTADRNGTIWAIEQRVWLETQERLPDRLLRTDGQGWETVELPDVGVAVEPWAIELAPDGRLLVDFIASSPGPDLPPGERRPLQDHGEGRWLGRLGQEGSWDIQPIPVSSSPAWRWMAGATSERVWFPLGGTGPGCAGVASLGIEGVRYYLTDKCIYSLVVAPDQWVWVAASDHGGYDDIVDVGLYVITPDRVITPAPTPEPALGGMDWDDQTGYLLEPVEAGVERFVRDGAGHRADLLPTSRDMLSGMTAGEDGYLWLPTEQYVIHLGYGDHLDNPLGPGVAELDVESVDDDPFEVLWIRNAGLAAGDRVLLQPDGDYPRPQAMTRAPGGGMLVSVQDDDGNELQLIKGGGEFPGAAVAPRLPSEGPDWRLRDLVVHRELWAIEDRVWLDEATRKPSRLWQFGGSGWSQVHPLGPEVDAEPRALLTTPANDLVVEMVGSATPPDGDHETSRPIGRYGTGRWLLRSDVGDAWETWLDVPGAEPEVGRLLGVTNDRAWFDAADSGPCRGLLARSQDGVDRYLDGICPYALVVTSEGHVWVAGGDTRDEAEVGEPAIYRITPSADPTDRKDVSHGY